MTSLIVELYKFLNQEQKKYLFKLVILTVMSTVMEIVTIGAVVPFISILSGSEASPEMLGALKNYISFQGDGSSEAMVYISCIFLLAIAISCLLRIILLRKTNAFAFETGAAISRRIYGNLISLRYEEFIRTNSGNLIDMLTKKVEHVVHGFLIPIVNIVSGIILTLGIVFVLFTINKLVTIVTFSFFILTYSVITLSVRNVLHRNSHIIADKSIDSIKHVQSTYGFIRDVILDSQQKFFQKKYDALQSELADALTTNLNVANSPRYLIETISIAGVVIIAWYFKESSTEGSLLLPTMGAIVLGAQRMLPCAQQIYGGFANMKASQQSLSSLLNFCNMSIDESCIEHKLLMKFEKLELNNISYKYKGALKNAIQNCNGSIVSGRRYGVSGDSGSGKSTLVDLLSGLLFPTKGSISFNGIRLSPVNINILRSYVSYVPQSIYISDDTLLHNIAFGVAHDEIDFCKVSQSIISANLQKVVEELPDGLNSKLGENGAYLSGGQRQRVGIARALYRKSDIIIFDEATSALDSKVEGEIMETIYSLDRSITLIIIAHRLETLKKCEELISVDAGRVEFRNV